MFSFRTFLMAAFAATLVSITLVPAGALAADPGKLKPIEAASVSYVNCDSGAKLDGKECVLRKRFSGKEITFWNNGSRADSGKVVAAMTAGCKKAGFTGARTPDIDYDFKGDGKPYGQGYITCTKPAKQIVTCPKNYSKKDLGDGPVCVLTSCPNGYKVTKPGTESAKCVKADAAPKPESKPENAPQSSSPGGSAGGGGGSTTTTGTTPAPAAKPKPKVTCKSWQTAKGKKCIDKPCPKSTKKKPLKRDARGKCVAAGSVTPGGSAAPGKPGAPTVSRPSNASGAGVVTTAPDVETQNPHPNYDGQYGPGEGTEGGERPVQ